MCAFSHVILQGWEGMMIKIKSFGIIKNSNRNCCDTFYEQAITTKNYSLRKDLKKGFRVKYPIKLCCGTTVDSYPRERLVES